MHPLFALGLPGLPELLLIGVIALVFFGPKKLPELARGLGQSLKEFQKAKDEFQEQIHAPAARVVAVPSKQAPLERAESADAPGSVPPPPVTKPV